MADLTVTSKDSNSKLQNQRPVRYFLKENIENLRDIEKLRKRTKVGSQSREISIICSKELEKKQDSTVDVHYAAKFGRTRKNGSINESKVLHEIYIRKPDMVHKSSQTWDLADDSFWVDIKVLHPSVHVLDEIQRKKAEEIKKLTKNEKKVMDGHTYKFSAHISDLSEYLEKGSISRRKRKQNASKHEKCRASDVNMFIINGGKIQ